MFSVHPCRRQAHHVRHSYLAPLMMNELLRRRNLLYKRPVARHRPEEASAQWLMMDWVQSPDCQLISGLSNWQAAQMEAKNIWWKDGVLTCSVPFRRDESLDRELAPWFLASNHVVFGHCPETTRCSSSIFAGGIIFFRLSCPMGVGLYCELSEPNKRIPSPGGFCFSPFTSSSAVSPGVWVLYLNSPDFIYRSLHTRLPRLSRHGAKEFYHPLITLHAMFSDPSSASSTVSSKRATSPLSACQSPLGSYPLVSLYPLHHLDSLQV